jgi:hypothetical protein
MINADKMRSTPFMSMLLAKSRSMANDEDNGIREPQFMLVIISQNGVRPSTSQTPSSTSERMGPAVASLPGLKRNTVQQILCRSMCKLIDTLERRSGFLPVERPR